MADETKDIVTDEIPEPISREDKLLHNIIDGTPDISELKPKSREEVYLKHIAMNGGSGGGSSVNVVQETGNSTTDVMSQNAVTKELDEINTSIALLGTASYCDTGLKEGNVPILDSNGKLNDSVIPQIALTDTFTANSLNEMLNIEGAEKGDICIRTDENKTYILDTDPKPYRTLALTVTNEDDWIELLTPTDEVTSVNGQKGNVTIDVPNIVQTRGTSETDVMSQKAVTNNTCFGASATSTGTDSISIGNSTKASYLGAISIGKSCYSNDEKSVAIGYNAGSGIRSIVIGDSARGTSSDTIAIGGSTNITSFSSIGIGYKSATANSNAVLIGSLTSSTGNYTVCLGSYSKATEPSVVSVGDGSTNSSYGTRRIINVKDPTGNQDAATKKYVDTQIKDTKQYVDDQIAESGGGSSINVVQEIGDSETDVMSQAAVSKNTCFGTNSAIYNSNCVSFGNSAKASAAYTTSIGYNSQSTASGNTSVGYNAKATGTNNTSIGYGAETTSENCTAVGYQATAYTLGSGGNCTAFGYQATAKSRSSTGNCTAIGYKATTSDLFSTSIGYNAIGSNGGYDTVIGSNAKSSSAKGNCTCLGCYTEGSTGGYDTVIGTYSKASSSSGYGVCLGYNAKESGGYGVSLGPYTEASAQLGVALGYGSKATEQSVVSVGSGTDSALYGTRRIVNVRDPENDQDAATKKYVDEKVSEGGGGSGIVSHTITLYQNSWNYETPSVGLAHYSQSINIDTSVIDITDDIIPIVSLISDDFSSTTGDAKTQLSEFNKICQVETDENNNVVFRCFESPTISLPTLILFVK